MTPVPVWPFRRHHADEARPDVDAAIDAAAARLQDAVMELEHYAKYVTEEREARKP